MSKDQNSTQNISTFLNKIFELNKDYNGLLEEANIDYINNNNGNNDNNDNNDKMLLSEVNASNLYNIDQSGGAVDYIKQIFLRNNSLQNGGNYNEISEIHEFDESPVSDNKSSEEMEDDGYKAKYYKYKTKFFKLMANKYN